MIDDKVKEYLRAAMEKKDVSVNALAIKMGESQSTLNRQINAGVAISFQRVYHICMALDIDMHDLIDGIRSKKKKRA